MDEEEASKISYIINIMLLSFPLASWICVALYLASMAFSDRGD